MVHNLRQSLLTIPLIMLASVPAFASAPPDGIYDLVVGGDKQGVAVVEGGKFTRPVHAGKCVLTEATGVLIGETLTISVPDDCLSKSLLDFRCNQGMLQFRDSASWYINTSASTTDGYGPSLSLASGLFLGEHYLYSDAHLDTRYGKYNRGDSHVSRDIPTLSSRLTVGDHAVESGSALVSGNRIAGLLFTRNWQQDPDRAATVYYSSSHRLKLTSQSTVEIFRDGQLVDRRELSAGDYDIRNLPVAAYASRIKIRVTDSYGSQKEIEADMINPPRLLSKGTLDYSLSFGTKRIGHEGAGSYQGMTGGGYIGYGVTDWLSLYLSSMDRILTHTATIATTMGLVSGEARVDKLNDWRAAYSYSWRNVGINAEHSVVKNSHGAVERKTSANVSVSLSIAGTLSARYADGDYRSYGVGYSVSLPWSLSLSSTADFASEGRTGFSAGVTKQWMKMLSTQVSYTKGLDRSDTLFAQFSFALDRSRPRAVGLQAASTTRDGKSSVQATTEGRYGVYASVTTNTPSYGPTSTTATIAASLACAEGACRVGEPVSGGFAVGDGLESNSYAGAVLNMPAYTNTLLVASSRTATESQVVAVRPGQGVRLTVYDKVDVQAVVMLNGAPAKNAVVTWEGGETITGEDGLLWLERIPKKPVNLEIAGRQVIIPMDKEVADGVIDVGIIHLGSSKNTNSASYEAQTKVL